MIQARSYPALGLVVALAMSLIACDGGDRHPDPATEPRADSTASPAAASDPDSPLSQPAVPGPLRLAVEGEGVRGFEATSGSARPVPFGSPKSTVLAFLEAIHGGPPREQGENLDCGAEFAAWDDGLVSWFADDRFVGWSLRGGSTPVTTASGIGIGSSRGELESSYDVQVARSSLGVEFTAGGVAGLLDSDRSDARVTNLWAGVTCIAR